MKTIETLNTEEADKLLIVLLSGYGKPGTKAKAVRNHTMALLMLDAGLRVGEVVRLRMCDLITNGNLVESLIIPWQITKNKSERTVPLSLRLRTALGVHLLPVYKEHPETFCDPIFFCRDYTKPITVRQVENIIKQAGQKAIGRDIHPHVLRHTFATRLMRQTNIRVVQQLLGHKSISSTQVYTHPNSEDLTNAIEAISS